MQKNMAKLSTSKKPGLSEKQMSFVDHFVSGGLCQTDAAQCAGYNSPRTAAWRLLQNPRVLEAIRLCRQRYYSGDMARVATATIREIMLDADAPASARVSAARTTLELAGDLGRKDEQGNIKQLSELTPDELSGMITAWEDERAALAKDVTPTVAA